MNIEPQWLAGLIGVIAPLIIRSDGLQAQDFQEDGKV